MKDEVLKREMFAAPMSKASRNSGIMAGFEDMDEDEYENAQQEEQVNRSPNSPEILMNNLRGDFRSVDARRMELAQMVGEEAAAETPDEVLAMLQMQLAAQQGGIGGLPQAQGMMPPAMPPQGAMPQGGIPQPPGMESAPPFSQGGASEAPPTPDGLPPMHAQSGAFISKSGRLGEILDAGVGRIRPMITAAEEAAARANKSLGEAIYAPQFTTSRMVGGEPPMPLTVQGRESLLRNPETGAITQGTGTQLAPFNTLDTYTPTFTEGLSMGIKQAASDFSQKYPRLSKMFPFLATGATLGAMPMMGPDTGTPEPTPAEASNRREAEKMLKQIPTKDTPEDIERAWRPYNEMAASETSRLLGNYPPTPPTPDQPVPEKGDLDAFIKQKLAAFDQRQLANKPEEFVEGSQKAVVPADMLSRSERVRSAYGEYQPLFKEILGENKDDVRTNALLMLADAGFKLAGSRQPTFGMALAEATQALPRGFAALQAQSRERDLKINSAALERAIGDVQEQDRIAAQQKMQILRGDYQLLLKQMEQAAKGGVKWTDGGMGLRIGTDRATDSQLGVALDPDDPTIKSAVNSRWTLRDTDNPFVINRGKAPTTMETDKGERTKLGTNLRALDDSLAQVESAKRAIINAYGPGAWYSNFENNMVVPVTPLTANIADAKAKATVDQALNRIKGNLARVNSSGRDSVQEQQWIDEILPAKAGTFFQDVEVNMARLNSLEAMMRNLRQSTLTQLGYESNDYTMEPVSLGTKNDPFVIPANPQDRQRMVTFLGSTVGRASNPNAVVYLKTADGKIAPVQASSLAQMISGGQ